MKIKYLSAAAYVGAIVLANYLTSAFGFVPVGFGLLSPAGTYMAGFALLARDVVQDYAGRKAVFALMLAGALVSAVLAGPQLALASGVAFAVSELADMAVYSPLRKRGRIRAMLASNAVGAFIDSIIFLLIAGFPVASALPGQMVGKAWATVVPIAAHEGYKRTRKKT